MISIVIPTYNNEKHILALIESILNQPFKDYEIVIVDDGSTDNTVEIIKEYNQIKLIQLEKNLGPARTRNVGVENAKGDIILFLDSDVVIDKAVLEKVDRFFKENKDAVSLIGAYSKDPVNKGFVPKFKALLDYYIFVLPNKKTVTSFEPRCGAVKKSAFEEIGGFDPRYKWLREVEDFEFGYRLLKKGPIYIDTSIQVDHNFPYLKTLLRNFLKRGYQWVNLFLLRKKFDNVGATAGAAFSRGSSFLSLLFLLSSIFYFNFIYFALLFFIIGILGNIEFYKLILKETNILFLFGAIILDYVLSVLLGVSAIAAILTFPFKKKYERKVLIQETSRKSVLLLFPKHSPFPHSTGFPLTIYSLGKYLEKEDFEVDYFDERVDKKDKLIGYLKKNPLFVGLSTMTSYQITSSLKLAKFIRKFDPKLPLVWGGVHPTMLPLQTIKNKYVDYVVFGEGEETLKELTEYFLGKKEKEGIPGLAWKKDGQINKNEERKLLDYSKIPFPYDVDEVTLRKYLKKDTKITARQPVFYMSSRGCPFGCRFCYNHHFNKHIWRPRDLGLIEKELSELKKRGIKRIFFADDNIAVTKEHLLGICKIMKKLDLKWSACIRVTHITEKMAKTLEESNCDYLLFGVESGNKEMLEYMNKGITVEEVKSCVSNLSNTKIIGMYSFMFGFPTEADNHMKESFDLVDWIIQKDPKSEIQFQIYTPYPGTPMYKEAVEKGFKNPQSLEQWSEFVCDEVNVPWVKDKTLLRNLYVISVFAFRNKEFLKSRIFYIPHKIALWRWKHRFFKFSYERLIYDIVKKIPWLD